MAENNHPLAMYRAGRKITQETLAGELGVTSVTIWRWEHRKRFPHPKVARRISDHTKIPVGDLLNAPKDRECA